MRFDFHPTQEGWALSEVNSDVPGGFAEASVLPRLAVCHVANTRPGPDAGEALVAAMNRRLGAGARLGFVHATAYADDRQVMQFLASRFSAAGYDCTLMAPDHLRWQSGQAVSIAQANPGAMDGVVRFFPAEWLPMLPASSGWPGYFGARTLACNPAHAVLSQSKRNPLIWDRLGVALPAWRACLPQTRDPREVPWEKDESWLVKPAFGRVGEGLAWRGGVVSKAWRRTRWNVGLNPRGWVAQQRFSSRPLAQKNSERHLCVGLFTVDGKAAGFYGRLSRTTTIDKHAQDVAILIDGETTCR
jgi:glutathionylspermidine synthase